LAALGQQDVYLTGSPTVTYYSAVYKSHTPFVLEAFEVPFEGNGVVAGQNNIVRIPVKGDLIRATTLKLTLPPLAEYGQDWFWNTKPDANFIPFVQIDSYNRSATIPFAQQYYSSNSFATWASSIPGVAYDPNLEKFIFTASTVVVTDPAFATNLTSSAVFWGFDPKNYTATDGEGGLIYKGTNGTVIPDFTLEQAGWSRAIGLPVNTLSGIFLKLNQQIDPEGFVNLSQLSPGGLVWANADTPAAYTVTPGGRINITQTGAYMIRVSFVGVGCTFQVGSDTGDGPPSSPNFWTLNRIPVSSNYLVSTALPIYVTDVTQNWYFFVRNAIGPGSYISIQPIDGYFGSSRYSPPPNYNNLIGNQFPFNLAYFLYNGEGVTSLAPTITFNYTGQWILSGVINTAGSCLISSIQLTDGDAKIFATYDFTNQLATISPEFFFNINVTDITQNYAININTVGSAPSIDLSTSFVATTLVGLSSPGSYGYTNGGFILPLNGLTFDVHGTITNPLTVNGENGVENMISLSGGNIKFNNVGTYMMTTYLPVLKATSTAWDPILAWPGMVLTNGDLTVTAFPGNTEPTMLLSTTLPSGTKFMYSVSLDIVTGSETTAVGVANVSMDTTSYLGADLNSFGYYEDGVIYTGGAYAPPKDPGLPLQTSNVIDVAVDTSAKFIWIRVDGGKWTSNAGGAGGNPATGLLGFDISYISGTLKFGVDVYNGGRMTYNTSNLYPIPTGFTFIPGVSNASTAITNFNSYTNVNSNDTLFTAALLSTAVDSSGNIYWCPNAGSCIFKGSSIYAGDFVDVQPPPPSLGDGTGLSAIVSATSLGYGNGNLYFTDNIAATLRVIYPGGIVRTISGTGSGGDSKGLDTSYVNPTNICVENSNVYIVDNGTLRLYNINTTDTLTFSQSSSSFEQNPEYPLTGVTCVAAQTFAGNGVYYVYIGTEDYIILRWTPPSTLLQYVGLPGVSGFTDGLGIAARFTSITAIVSYNNLEIWVCDSGKIRIVTGGPGGYGYVGTSDTTIQAGTSTFALKFPYIYYAAGNVVKSIQLKTQVITNIYGSDYNYIEGANLVEAGGVYTQTVPIRVASAPVTYPINIGNVGSTFAPGAFIAVYPITSNVLPPDYSQYHYYDSVGTWAIVNADFKVGGQTIESLTGEAIEIWNDLKVPYENQPGLKLLTGKYDTTIASGRDYYINLPFYFYENSALYFPISTVYRQDVEIWITFRTLQQLTAIDTAPNPINATLIVEYVYLAQPEITWFNKTRLNYVVEQYQYQEYDLGPSFTQGIFEIIFENPITELFFVIQIDGTVPYNWSNDGLANLGITINGEEIVTNRITDPTQLAVLEPYNNYITYPTRNFYMKKFVSPINFSRLRYVNLELNISRTDGYYPAKQFRIIGVSKNVLGVADGLAGLMFIS